MKLLIEVERVGDLASMLLVGALWGCTNPLLRKGSLEAEQQQQQRTAGTNTSFLKSTFLAFLNFKVWIPYLLNQSGSIVFYMLLANSDLSLAVPICNAMALLFSFGMSALLGEHTENPCRTIIGAALVLVGVTICVSAQ